MNGILDAAVEVHRALQQARVQFCIIGGIAVQRWGQPRTTLDVDVTVMAEFGQEAPIIQTIVSLFDPRIANAAQFAEQSRVLLLKTASGVGIDVSLGALPFEARMIERSSVWSIDLDRSLRTCSAEDLIIQKVFAGRDEDWLDVRRIIERQQATRLDVALIRVELQPLLQLKDDQDSAACLDKLLQEA